MANSGPFNTMSPREEFRQVRPPADNNKKFCSMLDTRINQLHTIDYCGSRLEETFYSKNIKTELEYVHTMRINHSNFEFLLVISNPFESDYLDFFVRACSFLPKETNQLDVAFASESKCTSDLGFALLSTYSQLRQLLSSLGFEISLSIDILLKLPSDSCLSKYKTIFKVQSESIPFIDSKILEIDAKLGSTLGRYPSLKSSSSLSPQKSVAVGGTFDHLHDGHKILLLLAAHCSYSKIVVGITGPMLLKEKKFSEMLEPFQSRVLKVTKFLQKIISPQHSFAIFQINDVCGPTRFIKDIEVLVISEETRSGADYVNNYRRSVGFNELDVVCAPILGGNGDESNNWRGKISSTDFREIKWRTKYS